MMRRLFLASGLALALAASTPLVALAQAQPAPTAKRHKLVIQVSDNDPAKWNLALSNAKNVQQDMGAANVDIEVVAYGPGLDMLKMESVSGARVAEAMQAKVKVIACENTMTAQKIGKADMLPGIAYVPAGVSEIMVRQSEGWAYVRP
jgi:uncharacterized protein